jgi:hypothetical protein
MSIEAILCTQPGCVDLRDVRYPDDDVLHLTAAEWTEFLEAVQRGDFGKLIRPDGTTREPSLETVCTQSRRRCPPSSYQEALPRLAVMVCYWLCPFGGRRVRAERRL